MPRSRANACLSVVGTSTSSPTEALQAAAMKSPDNPADSLYGDFGAQGHLLGEMQDRSKPKKSKALVLVSSEERRRRHRTARLRRPPPRHFSVASSTHSPAHSTGHPARYVRGC